MVDGGRSNYNKESGTIKDRSTRGELNTNVVGRRAVRGNESLEVDGWIEKVLARSHLSLAA